VIQLFLNRIWGKASTHNIDALFSAKKLQKKAEIQGTDQLVLFTTAQVYDYFAICLFLGMFKIFKIRRKTKSSSHTLGR